MPTSSTRFVRNWQEVLRPAGPSIYRPVMPIFVRGQSDFILRDFLVDSGADLSMASHELCRQLGLRWREGIPTILSGISQRKTCQVQGRIHQVDLLIPDADLVFLSVPMIFARGNAPFVLGREGIFDALNITFEKTNHRTIFEQGAAHVPR